MVRTAWQASLFLACPLYCIRQIYSSTVMFGPFWTVATPATVRIKNNRKSKLRLDVEADAKSDLGGGRRALVPGDPEKSEVFKRISSANKALRMPPAYAGHDALNAHDQAILKAWIEQGAKYEPHWSFVVPKRPDLPQVRDTAWSKNAIDRFVLARLQHEGLKPSPEADKQTLIRRLTLDLTGLPPTPLEVEAFVADASPDAYEKVVDRLLASPHYAERMAIRWLEAARYADTNGYQTDGPRNMWPWRDWVIDAFAATCPTTSSLIEQLAGDLLPNATLRRRSRRHSIATIAPAPRAASWMRSSVSNTWRTVPRPRQRFGWG